MSKRSDTPRLTRGNLKLGRKIWGWSIPAVVTCPGMSSACDACYATRGFYIMPSVRDRLASNLRAAEAVSFVPLMCEEIDRRRADVVRVHVAGDFYSDHYCDQWRRIALARPAVRFYAYTRSWRVQSILRSLTSLASLPNVRLWFSADTDTGAPPAVRGVRVAWLQLRQGEDVGAADLIFRDAPARQTPARRIGLTVVCPVEVTAAPSNVTCTSCRICWYA